MCQTLAGIRQAISAYAAAMDMAALSPAQASEIVQECAQIEASAASLKVLGALRAAESKSWQQLGYRGPAEHLADQTGTNPGAARRALETAERLAHQPEVARAALAGALSLEQAGAVSDGAAADPTKTIELIDLARRSSISELNEAVATIKAGQCDQEERHRARHAKRSVRRWTDRDGALNGRIYGHPEDGALLWRMLDPIRRRLNILHRENREDGSPDATESLDALDYDALMTIAAAAVGKPGELSFLELVELGLFPQANTLTPAGHPHLPQPPHPPATTVKNKKLAGSPLRVMIRVDLDALLRGVAIEGELCEIAGSGPIPVSVVKDLLATENPFITGILTRGEAVVGVYHHRRHPNAHQRSALDFLYPTCAAQGCPTRAGLQYDHRHDYSTSKITAFDLLDRLCVHHHNLKTRSNWALVNGRGKRPFVPPDDPRHPGHATGPPGPPGPHATGPPGPHG